MIESAFVYQNESNFEYAIECFEKAKTMWLEHVKKPPGNDKSFLRKEQDLFFELSIASVYENQGKDDLALYHYIKAKKIKLAINHPDQAFAYCGLGSVVYHMQEPHYALRLY